jgi:hypothetical protein
MRRSVSGYAFLYPAYDFPKCAARCGQEAVGKLGRWLGLALGAILAIPAFAGGLLFLPMLFVARPCPRRRRPSNAGRA